MRSITQRCLVVFLIVCGGMLMSGHVVSAKPIDCTAVDKWAKVIVHSSSDVSVDEGDKTCTFTIDHATKSSHEHVQILSRYATRIVQGFGFFAVVDPDDGTPGSILYEMLPLILAAPRINNDDDENDRIKEAMELVKSNESFFKDCIEQLYRFRTSEDPSISPFMPEDRWQCSSVQEGYFVFAISPLQIYLSHRPWGGWRNQQLYRQLDQQAITAIAESPDISMTKTDVKEIIEKYKMEFNSVF
jgi:hypothetical protein